MFFTVILTINSVSRPSSVCPTPIRIKDDTGLRRSSRIFITIRAAADILCDSGTFRGDGMLAVIGPAPGGADARWQSH